jgi:CBS domain-containing protein
MSAMSSVVGDVMTRNVVSVREQAQYKEIILVMRERAFSACPVLNADDTVVGVVSEDDLLVKEAYSGPKGRSGFPARILDKPKATGLTACQLMTHPAISIRPDAPVAEAARIMHAKHVKRLPVALSLLDAIRKVDGVVAVRDRLCYPQH